ncbi:MAG: cell division protein FtsB [Gammaproteobacteria bacterium]|nr:MAG: cell division protein FtsB [Gammaproteobacteria bacterium]
MRILVATLLLLLLALQYRLWFGAGGVAELHRLRAQVDELSQTNEQLSERNAALERDVRELKTGTAGIEQRARTDFGMIAKDEVFYQVVEPEQKTAAGDGDARE